MYYKKIICITLLVLIYPLKDFAQSGVSINTTGANANSSAILDISSTSSGLLIPRMTKAQKIAISQPANGLLIYQTNDTTGFWYYDNSIWKQIGSAAGGGLTQGTINGNTLYWNGIQWTESSNIYNEGGPVGIGTNSPELSAKLDINSSNSGLLIPRMTILERNAIQNTAEGLQIFNIDTKCLELYTNSTWYSYYCGCTAIPSNVSASVSSNSLCSGNTLILIGNADNATSWQWAGPNGFTSSLQIAVKNNVNNNATGTYSLTASNSCGSAPTINTTSVIVNSSVPTTPTAISGSNQTVNSFQANWNITNDATGYYLDVSTDASFNSYITGYYSYVSGNVLYTNVTGLTVGTTYYYRVRATNNCGISNYSNTITTNTLWACGSPFTKTHSTSNGVAPLNKTVTYGTVQTSISGASKCWITRNLGASNQPSSATDASDAAAGWYWQFNRKQGYTPGPTPTWTITSINETSDWITANDPCKIEFGTGGRIPTYTEWNNTNGSPQNWSNTSNIFNSVLKLHAGGLMQATSGAIFARGNSAFYNSNTQYNDTYSWALETVPSYSNMNYSNSRKAAGLNLRCIKD